MEDMWIRDCDEDKRVEQKKQTPLKEKKILFQIEKCCLVIDS